MPTHIRELIELLPNLIVHDMRNEVYTLSSETLSTASDSDGDRHPSVHHVSADALMRRQALRTLSSVAKVFYNSNRLNSCIESQQSVISILEYLSS